MRDGQDWREKQDGQGQGSYVTRASLLALVARTPSFRDEPS
jgi:hypothetical protein